MKVLIGIVIILLLVGGCVNNDNCFDDCVNTYKNTAPEFESSNCFSFVCMTKPSQDLKDHCFNECYDLEAQK